MGEAVDVNDFIKFLKQLDHRVTAVFSQFCETSTGVLHPVHELGHALKNYDDSLYFVVDGVSCIGAVEVDLIKDKIDVLVSGSQKPSCYLLVLLLLLIVTELKIVLLK